MRFRERLWQPWPLWLAGTAMTASLGIAYGHVTTAPAGWAVFAAAEAVLVVAMMRTAVVVAVADDGLHAAAAHLTPEYIGTVTPLTRDEAAALRGVAADPRAHLCLKGWIATAVRVDVDDPDDPHPYWYVSTRRPAELAAAVSAVARTRP